MVLVAGEAAPKMLEPNVGVLFVFPVAPKAPNVAVLVAGSNKDFAAGAAAVEPNVEGLAAGVVLVLLAPKENAFVADSAGFAVEGEDELAKLNPAEPVDAAAPPKIELPAVDAGEELAATAPNVPNVGLSEEAVVDATEPNEGITLFTG